MGILRKLFSTKLNTGCGKKPSVLSLLFSNPEKFKLEAWIENDEIKVNIKRKENANNG